MKPVALTLAVVTALLAISLLPPGSNFVDSFLVNYFPPKRAQYVVSLLQGRMNNMMLLTALKVGLFDYLEAHGRQTVPQLAAGLKVSERGLRVLCENLVVLHLLTTDGTTVSNSGATRAHLLPGTEDSFLDMFQIFSAPHTTAAVEYMPFAVEHGKLPPAAPHAETPDLQFWVDFAEKTGHMASQGGRDLVAVLRKHNISLSGTWLDTAAGSGEFGAAVAEAGKPQAQVTFFDFPHVITHTQALVTKRHEGIRSQVTFQAGDLFKYDFAPGKYDHVLAMNIFHHFNFSESVKLAEVYFKTLKSKGSVVVSEFLRGDTEFPTWREFNPFPRFFNMIMLLTTEDGEAFSHTAMVKILEAAGFVDVRITGQFPKPASFIIATKP